MRPAFTSKAVYALGLPTRGNRRVATMIYTQNPSLLVDIGSHLALIYSPAWVDYTAAGFSDSLAQSVSLAAAGQVGEWGVQISENYSISNSILAETGRQTKQTVWATSLSAGRSLSERLNWQTTLGVTERYAETTSRVRDWNSLHMLTVRLPFNLETGLGAGANYTELKAQPDAITLQYLGRLNWSPTEKFSLSLDSGFQNRRLRGSPTPDLTNPIINGSAVYRPFSTTTLTVSTARTIAVSYFENQITDPKNWSVAIQQRFLKLFFCSASYSLKDSTYSAARGDTAPSPDEDSSDGSLQSLPGRSDKAETITAAISTTLRKRVSVSVSYSLNQNQSSQSAFSFDSRQYGLEVGIRF